MSGQRTTVTDGVTTVLAHSVEGYRLTAEDENTIMAAMAEAAENWPVKGWQGVPGIEAIGHHSIGCTYRDLRFPELCWINLKAQLLMLGGYEHPWVDRAQCENREGVSYTDSDYAVGPVAG